jgi:TRAP-type C4-dicarboxylate transport system permease small subunit
MSSASRFADHAWRQLIRAQRVVMIGASVLVATLVLGSVLMRYVFYYPGMEVEELATMVAMWLYFVGASYGSYDRSHVKAELAHVLIKTPRVYALVKVAASVITVGLAVFMTYLGWGLFKWGLVMAAESPVLRIPMVYSQSAILVSAALMSMYFFVELIDNVRQAMGIVPVSRPNE